MPADFAITEKDIIKACGSKAFERGMEYCKQGRVRNVTIYGNTVKAAVIGSDKYRVEIKLGKGVIEGECTCPVGYSCKHVVATLLFIKDGKTATKIEDIKSYLGKMQKEELIRLILRTPSDAMLKSIKLDMASKKKKLDTETYKEEIDNALEIGHYFDYNETFGLVSALRETKNTLEKLVESGFRSEARLLLLHFIKGCVKKEEECDDSNGDVGEIAIDAGDILAKALKGLDVDEVTLQELVRLYKDAADYGLEDSVYNAIKGLDNKSLKALEGILKNRNDDESKWLYREAINLQGRHEDYINMCSDSGDYFEVIEKLEELGRINEAITLAREKSESYGMKEKLFELLLTSGRTNEALSCAWELFKDRSAGDNIEKIKEISLKLEMWKGEKAKAVKFLETSGENNDLLVALCIEDGDFNKALKNTKGIHESTAARLAVALEKKMPEEAAAIFKRLAEDNIQRMGNERYKAAKMYLEDVKKIRKIAGKEKEWEKYIGNLREVHKAKRNLISEIAKL